MFADELRRAVEASPRVELPKLSAVLWKAYAAGTVAEEQASDLAALIEARKAIPAPQKPVQRRSGSRPRSPASMERRRSWAACGRLPPQLAARFTLAEVAVLAVVAVEVEKHGACSLTLGHIAALAGVCRTTVKNALRQAHILGLLRIEERRLTAWRNAPNRITVTSPEWLSWMRLRGGGKTVPPTGTPDSRKRALRDAEGAGEVSRTRNPRACADRERPSRSSTGENMR